MPNSFSPLMVSRICERSITWPPEAVVSGAVRRRHVPQPKRVRGRYGDWGSGLTAPGEDVQDHIRRMDTLTQRLLAGGLDRGQAVAQNGGEDVDKLAVAIGGTDELAADPLQPGGQNPVLERRAVAQGSRLTGKDGNVVPRIADRPVAPEPAGVLADHAPVLADLDPLGIGPDLHRAPDRARGHRVAVVVEAHQAGLRDRRGHGMEPVEPSGIGHQAAALHLEHLPDRAVPELGVPMRLGVGDRLIRQPGVQLGVALHPDAGREEALAHEADLVLHLSLLPARGRRAGHRIDQEVAAHLEEAAVVEAGLFRAKSPPPRLFFVVYYPAGGA